MNWKLNNVAAHREDLGQVFMALGQVGGAQGLMRLRGSAGVESWLCLVHSCECPQAVVSSSVGTGSGSWGQAGDGRTGLSLTQLSLWPSGACLPPVQLKREIAQEQHVRISILSLSGVPMEQRKCLGLSF